MAGGTQELLEDVLARWESHVDDPDGLPRCTLGMRRPSSEPADIVIL